MPDGPDQPGSQNVKDSVQKSHIQDIVLEYHSQDLGRESHIWEFGVGITYMRYSIGLTFKGLSIEIKCVGFSTGTDGLGSTIGSVWGAVFGVCAHSLRFCFQSDRDRTLDLGRWTSGYRALVPLAWREGQTPPALPCGPCKK